MDNFLLLESGFAISMFLGTFIGYYFPLKLLDRQKRSRNEFRQLADAELMADSCDSAVKTSETWIASCNCVGAGIFVAICFLGLMPVVKEEFEGFFKEANITGVTYPVSELTVLFGFFFVLVLEELVMMCRFGKKPPVLYLDEVASEQSHRLLEESPSTNKQEDNFDEITDSVIADGQKRTKATSNGHAHHGHVHSHSHSHAHSQLATESGLTFFVLMFATSVHSVFEGLALGLIKDTARAMHIFVGIILHECIVAVALGLNAAKINPSLRANLKFAVAFSATVPIGIVLGVAVGYTPGALGRLISAIFQGLAAGTFLHVAFCELIPAELTEAPNASGSFWGKRIVKIFLIFVGYVLMALLTLLTDH